MQLLAQRAARFARAGIGRWFVRHTHPGVVRIALSQRPRPAAETTSPQLGFDHTTQPPALCQLCRFWPQRTRLRGAVRHQRSILRPAAVAPPPDRSSTLNGSSCERSPARQGRSQTPDTALLWLHDNRSAQRSRILGRSHPPQAMNQPTSLAARECFAIRFTATPASRMSQIHVLCIIHTILHLPIDGITVRQPDPRRVDLFTTQPVLGMLDRVRNAAASASCNQHGCPVCCHVRLGDNRTGRVQNQCVASTDPAALTWMRSERGGFKRDIRGLSIWRHCWSLVRHRRRCLCRGGGLHNSARAGILPRRHPISSDSWRGSSTTTTPPDRAVTASLPGRASVSSHWASRTVARSASGYGTATPSSSTNEHKLCKPIKQAVQLVETSTKTRPAGRPIRRSRALIPPPNVHVPTGTQLIPSRHVAMPTRRPQIERVEEGTTPRRLDLDRPAKPSPYSPPKPS